MKQTLFRRILRYEIIELPSHQDSHYYKIVKLKLVSHVVYVVKDSLSQFRDDHM